MRANLLYLVCMIFMCVLDKAHACLMISEVNCDNPRLDTQEFVELYFDGMNPTSLDGYTLVFYNGNGDTAYRIIDLKGHQTDPRGYFLIGSSELTPQPAISLPPNSVQNGPDAIALYGPNWAPVLDGGKVSGVGLLDAVVYTSRRSAEGADGLASVLTPGSLPYVEDEKALEGDESIQRCWQSNNLWTFHTGPPTPGWVNHCPPPSPGHIWINEVDLGGPEKRGLVELNVGMATGLFSVVLFDVTTDLISTSVEFNATRAGIFTVSVDTGSLAVKQSAALAVYKGPASNFSKGSPLSHQQPIDAFVYGDKKYMPSANLTQTLIPGRKPLIITESSFDTSGVSGSRCGVAEWTRDPGLFVKRLPSPGKPNDCIWFQTCPRNITSYTSTPGWNKPPFHSDNDFLINEINTDSPGAAEDEEFIELWHPSGFRMFLDFIWLVLINGQTGEVYFELELSEYYTDENGYFLIGSSKIGADVTIQANNIQNGPDAIAIYRSESSPSSESSGIPKKGLLDAVVYRSRGSDKKTGELTDALTPGQLPLLEDINALPGDETLSRCGSDRLNLSVYRVGSPTPRKPNDCPSKPTLAPPPKGVVFNEIGDKQSEQSMFVELSGPPLTSLRGLVLVFLDEGGQEKKSVPLTGSIGADGFYLVSNVSGADQSLTASLTDLSAVELCFEASGSGVCGSDSRRLDRFNFNTDLELRVDVLLKLYSVSRCESDGHPLWIYSHTSARLPNLCPNPSLSISVDLCLHLESCSKKDIAVLLEKSCKCGISSLHLEDVNASCESGGTHVQGPIVSISDQQREQINETLHVNGFLCYSTMNQPVRAAESSVGLQVGLVLTAFLLFGLGAALIAYLYKRRRPSDYLSMQMNEHPDTPLDL
ncbi:uncharacterized protein [Paramisgurnus dabryanus]|uniref:uncharacterized protein isoform X1 n=1 Tax=Paramisgurnus dabryanus TaxID=90735 RepID=UPI0031F46412